MVDRLRELPAEPRILDVGCGAGQAEVEIDRLHMSQVRLFGVDLKPTEAAKARREAAGHNLKAHFLAGDASRLPYATGTFDSLANSGQTVW